MKNKRFLVLMILLVFSLVFAACDNGNNPGNGSDNSSNGSDNSSNGDGDDNPFAGTWTGTGPGPVAVVVVMTEAKTFTQTQTGSFNGSLRGTYTYSGNTATFTVTASTMQPHVNVGDKFAATVSGNTLTHNGITLTKE